MRCVPSVRFLDTDVPERLSLTISPTYKLRDREPDDDEAPFVLLNLHGEAVVVTSTVSFPTMWRSKRKRTDEYVDAASMLTRSEIVGRFLGILATFVSNHRTLLGKSSQRDSLWFSTNQPSVYGRALWPPLPPLLATQTHTRHSSLFGPPLPPPAHRTAPFAHPSSFSPPPQAIYDQAYPATPSTTQNHRQTALSRLLCLHLRTARAAAATAGTAATARAAGGTQQPLARGPGPGPGPAGGSLRLALALALALGVLPSPPHTQQQQQQDHER